MISKSYTHQKGGGISIYYSQNISIKKNFFHKNLAISK